MLVKLHLVLLLAREVEHFSAKVASDHLRFPIESFGNRQGQVSRPGTDVQIRIPRLWIQKIQSPTPPIAIDIQRQQMVEEVIPRRDFGKHPPNTFGGLVDNGARIRKVGWAHRSVRPG